MSSAPRREIEVRDPRSGRLLGWIGRGPGNVWIALGPGGEEISAEGRVRRARRRVREAAARATLPAWTSGST